GTNGKTTTKELVAAILSSNYNVLATKGNLNNHIGVPLMLLQITDETEIAIIEMGANKRGDIKELCDIANPTLGLITNIGTAHIEGFGSAESLFLTKKELFDAVIQNKGTIFYSCNQNNFENIEYKNTITYGSSKDCTIFGNVLQNGFFFHMNINYNDANIAIKTNLVGNYNFENVLAAFSIGHFFNIPPEKAIDAISNYYPDNNRSQFLETPHNQIIADAYNANPSSMKVAISNFALLSTTKQKVLILGDMLELGKISKAEHQNLINELEKSDFETIFLVGNSFFSTKTNKIQFQKFKTTTELKTHLSANPLKNKLILLKGSRGIALEKIIEVL
ncbi:MAG: UDP-N-acetylmuramoyl-tripeptide--D-alanyl-D-alanine ligase, partial [Candidatus Zixiibacteriota bacterium]